MWFAFKNLQSKLLAENVNINYNLLYIFYYLLSWSWTLEDFQETFFSVSKRKWFTMEKPTAIVRSLRKSRTSWIFWNIFPVLIFDKNIRYPVWRCVDLSKMRLTRWSLTRWTSLLIDELFSFQFQTFPTDPPQHAGPGRLSAGVIQSQLIN